MAIASGQDFFDPNPQDIDTGNYLVFEADRQAEILDWLRCKDIPTAEKDRFIHSLINFDDNCGGFYDFRAYFLAAKYIAVFPNSSCAEEIAEQLLDWSQGNFWCRKSKIDFNKTIAKEADETLKLTDPRQAIAAYEQTIQDTQEHDLLISTAQKLLELDPQNEIAIATIGSELQNTDDRVTIFKLISLCDEYEIATEIAVDSLVKLLGQINSGDSPECMAWISNTFYYLKKLAKGNRRAINGLIQLLNKIPSHYPREDIEICELILTTLGIIGKNDSVVVGVLENFLQMNQPDNMIYLAAKILRYVNPDREKAINIFTSLLDNNADPYYTKDAALAILNTPTNPALTEISIDRAISNILEFAQDNQYMDIETITALEQAAANSNIANEALVKLLNIIQNISSRAYIANAILKLDINNQKALNIIYYVLDNIDNETELYNTAKNLLNIIPDNQIALNTLNKLLTTAKQDYIRLEVAKQLALQDSANELAISTLCELVYLSEFLSICIDEQDLPLSVLEQIDPSKKLATKALEEFAKKTKDQDALIYIIKHLKRLDPSSDVAQQRLNRIIAAVINSMQTYAPSDDGSLLNVLIYGRGIRSSQLLLSTVNALKPYLNHQSSTNREIACLMIWKCAKQMSYRDFYRAWHM